jgi:ureidoacrylate peracid hydrolase
MPPEERMLDTLAPLETLEAVIQPSHTALLVIDVQNDFCGDNCQAMVPRLAKLIQTARDANVYVIYVQNSVHPGGLSSSPSEIARRKILNMREDVTVDGTAGQEFVSAIAPRPSDPVVRKHRMNSFLGTDLDMLLRCRGIKSIVTTGVATHGCVMNTSYAAVMNDYYVVVVEDCVASVQQSAHDLALSVLRNGIHYVRTAEQVSDIWRKQ